MKFLGLLLTSVLEEQANLEELHRGDVIILQRCYERVSSERVLEKFYTGLRCLKNFYTGFISQESELNTNNYIGT